MSTFHFLFFVFGSSTTPYCVGRNTEATHSFSASAKLYHEAQQHEQAYLLFQHALATSDSPQTEYEIAVWLAQVCVACRTSHLRQRVLQTCVQLGRAQEAVEHFSVALQSDQALYRDAARKALLLVLQQLLKLDLNPSDDTILNQLAGNDKIVTENERALLMLRIECVHVARCARAHASGCSAI